MKRHWEAPKGCWSGSCVVDGMSEFTEDIGQNAKQIGEQVEDGMEWLGQKVDGRVGGGDEGEEGDGR